LFSQYLAEFWDRKAHKKHRARLNDMKPAIDNTKPREYAHLMGKTGKKAMLAKGTKFQAFRLTAPVSL